LNDLNILDSFLLHTHFLPCPPKIEIIQDDFVFSNLPLSSRLARHLLYNVAGETLVKFAALSMGDDNGICKATDCLSS
jgi:hypothetical protein